MVWNSLPDDFRAQQDYESFRQGLKTWLFSRYYSVFSALETFMIIALYKSTFTILYHTLTMIVSQSASKWFVTVFYFEQCADRELKIFL